VCGLGRGMGAAGFCTFVFECISVVVGEGACVRGCRGLGVCTVDTVS
jgi:hypothetical protein